MCVQCVWERADMQASSHSQKVTQHLTHSQAAQIHCTTHGHNTMCVCVCVCVRSHIKIASLYTNVHLLFPFSL